MRENQLPKQSNLSAGVSHQQNQQVHALIHTSTTIFCCQGTHNSHFRGQHKAVYRPGAINRLPPLIEKSDWDIFIVRGSITWPVLTRRVVGTCTWAQKTNVWNTLDNADSLPFLVFQNGWSQRQSESKIFFPLAHIRQTEQKPWETQDQWLSQHLGFQFQFFRFIFSRL